MAQDPRPRVLLIHAAAYGLGVIVCAGINLWFSPERLWFVWVAAGWGIGIAAHALAYVLRERRVFPEPRVRGFAVHLFAYLAVIILLAILGLTVTPHAFWVVWVAFGWGAGVAAHGWAVFRR